MPSNVVNRKTLRTALATLLSALSGVGQPFQAVYDYKKSDFGGQSPVLVISSAGSKRTKQAQDTRVRSFIDLDADIFVIYSDEEASPAFTERDSENLLDDLEKEVCDLVEDNDVREDLGWAGLMYDDSGSDVDFNVVGGKLYRQETIPLRMEIFSE